jgi:1,4-dihydroxy-2-naphthoate octaprenyltransferase
MKNASLSVWIMAARPKTLPACVAPVLIGTAIAFEEGHFHASSAACALLGALFIQIGTNFANDYFDFKKGADTETRVGPTRATQAGLVSPWVMLLATIIAFGIACVPGYYLILRGGLPILFIGVISVICGVLYTGGPYPLGYLGLGDVFVLIFFGPVAVGGTYYVQSLQINSIVIIAGLAPGLLSTAILTVNNLRDIDEDRRSKKRTLAVRFGRTFARMEYLVALLLACVGVPGYICFITQMHVPILISSLTVLGSLPLLRIVFFSSVGSELNSVLAGTGKLLFVFSVLFSIGWLL